MGGESPPHIMENYADSFKKYNVWFEVITEEQGFTTIGYIKGRVYPLGSHGVHRNAVSAGNRWKQNVLKKHPELKGQQNES